MRNECKVLCIIVCSGSRGCCGPALHHSQWRDRFYELVLQAL